MVDTSFEQRKGRRTHVRRSYLVKSPVSRNISPDIDEPLFRLVIVVGGTLSLSLVLPLLICKPLRNLQLSTYWPGNTAPREPINAAVYCWLYGTEYVRYHHC